jgi:hypothetical protein
MLCAGSNPVRRIQIISIAGRRCPLGKDKDQAGWSISVKFRVRYLLLYILVLLGIVSALAFFYSRSDESVRETIGYGSSLFGASIAICALLYNAENIRSGNQEKKREAASRLIERWNHPNYVPLRTEARQLMLSTEGKRDELIQQLDSDVKARSLVVEQLNFFEEMAIAAGSGTADEEILNRFFGYLLPRTFFEYKPWIDRHRDIRKAPDYWAELEVIAKKWKDEHPGTIPG